MYLGSWHELPVHDLDRLGPGQVIEGPAVLDATTTTVLLRAGDRVTVTPLGWLDITL